MAAIEGEDKVLFTAQRIVKSLGKTSDAEDMLLILSAFDNRLSALSSFVSGGSKEASVPESPHLDPRFESAERIILEEANSTSISDDYLAAVDEIIQFAEDLNLGSSPCGDDGGSEALQRADTTLQLSMTRLEDEFRYLLFQNALPIEFDRLQRPNFPSSPIPAAGTYFTAEATESPKEISRYNRRSHGSGISFGGDEISIDFIHPDALNDLFEIAHRMIRAGYEKECCQVYFTVRREAWSDYMQQLGVEKLGIEEIQKVEWELLDDKMKKWTRAVKLFVQGLIMSEKRLCEMIFDGYDLIAEVCFVETTKVFMMQFLNFGEAVAIGRRSAEKLFRILYMYDVLDQVFPDIQMLFMDKDGGDYVYREAKGVLDGLAEAAVGTLVEFENQVGGEASRKPVHNGEIHPLVRYVMNYLKLLVDSSDTVNSLLEKVETAPVHEHMEKGDGSESEGRSPIARRLLALMNSLESNIEEKAKLYEDAAMQCIFLINNLLYIVQKVKDSELQNLLGVEWIKKRRGLIRQHATMYLRAAWTQPLFYLKDEGIGVNTSKVSQAALKEKFKNFNTCFEEIYSTQTGWRVPDSQLRDDLKISISQKLIPAYRSFLGRYGSLLESGRHSGKYIKYTPEELENYLLDLFEGNPLVLHHIRRKST